MRVFRGWNLADSTTIGGDQPAHRSAAHRSESRFGNSEVTFVVPCIQTSPYQTTSDGHRSLGGPSYRLIFCS